MERISWNQYFMAQSHLLALRSTCQRLMVGATIVRDKRIIAGGYNGSVSGSVHCIDEGCYVIDGHCVRTVHAEINALLQCAKFGVATEGAELYVTHFPCLQCCKSIIQSGIRKVYYAADYKNHPYAIELFQDAGVQTEKVKLEEVAVDVRIQEKKQYVDQLLDKLEEAGKGEQELSAFKQEAEQLFRV
ncbi:ComE operon protein 2 [Sediminibacillus dalangtanensis]|uniref:ComE operon protein 2 n=1 Tax=Sediminibacillus dalangtanensis TaxID=2729421 RepID=A0ABX7VSG4_9BACI|nr:ComE operon protein 2 [Sediminibacillus dalangtanensis]QTM99889.1 ComE operon protein 2 [Sediminibacillus dalangtanensis]